MNTSKAIKAMIAKAKANTALTGRVSNRIYFGAAPSTVAMPYVVLKATSPDGQARTFVASGDFNEAVYQWDIFDKSESPQTCELIASDLDLAFDRQTLTYSDATGIGCITEPGGMGPDWDGEAWMRVKMYAVTYKSN